ncbi:MAG TPA: hypothetical protein VH025_02300 [Solirubrobacteraceae bacterium]|jgi:hypothetical protein|nr:hypothetical protein [Solirubrobacteraceae bacterium]
MADATITEDAQDAGPELDAQATVEQPAVEKAEAKKPKKPEKSEKKAKKDGKDKGKKQAAEGASGEGPSIAAHPRATRSVQRAKSWGGLIGFLVGGYLSMPTHTVAAAGARALMAGVICYVAVWAGAVFIWRRLVVLEIKAREEQLLGEVLAAREGAGGGARGRGA